MYGFTQTCPKPTALTAITQPTCPFRFDQIVKLMFQRKQTSTPFADAAALIVKANWTTLMAATDVTKVVASPIFTGFTIPKSEGIMQGGNDNSTFAGVAEYYGEQSVTASGIFKNLAPASKLTLKALIQYGIASGIGLSDLTVYMFNKDGYLFYQESPTGFFAGIPIWNWRIGSAGTEGLNSPNETPMGLTFAPNWDDSIKSTLPIAFDPLSELV